jgi:copper(I)-binding protein
MRGPVLLLGMLLAAGACASEGAGGVAVTHAWVRWLPGDLPAGGYATIENHGAHEVRLTGADSPDYAMVMLHRSVSENGMEHMQAADAIDVPAHASAALAPGGYHLMLMRPRHAVAPGDTVRVRLHFADGSAIDSAFAVRPATAGAP